MLNTIDVDIKETQSDDNNVQEKLIKKKNYKILETAAEYAGIQKVLLWEMYHNDYGVYVASRGQG